MEQSSPVWTTSECRTASLLDSNWLPRYGRSSVASVCRSGSTFGAWHRAMPRMIVAQVATVSNSRLVAPRHQFGSQHVAAVRRRLVNDGWDLTAAIAGIAGLSFTGCNSACEPQLEPSASDGDDDGRAAVNAADTALHTQRSMSRAAAGRLSRRTLGRRPQ